MKEVKANTDKKNVTIYDIAKKANVSAATVSRVLNNFEGISPAKRKVVLEIMEELNFTPNALAQSLSNKKSGTIGIIVPDITNEYFATLISEFELVAGRQGYTVLLGNAHSNLDRESEMLQTFKQKRVEAIIFLGGRVDNDHCPVKYIKELIDINKEIPVFLGSRLDGIRIDHMYLDFDRAAEKTVIHLKEQGCQTAGIIGGTDSINISKERRAIFRKYFKKHGILVKDEWVTEGDFSKQAGVDGINELIKLGDMPDTVFCINDLIAVGALYCASRNNIKVPQDLMVVGFDGISLSGMVFPEITTLQLDLKKSAVKLFDLINNKLNNDANPSDQNTKQAPIELTIKPKLVIRESTQRK